LDVELFAEVLNIELLDVELFAEVFNIELLDVEQFAEVFNIELLDVELFAEVFSIEVPRVQPHPPQEPSHDRLRRPPARYRNGSSGRERNSTGNSQKGEK